MFFLADESKIFIYKRVGYRSFGPSALLNLVFNDRHLFASCLQFGKLDDRLAVNIVGFVDRSR